MESASQLGERLLRLVGRLNRLANHRSRFTVPPAQLRLLALVHDLPDSRVGALAAADHSSQPTVTSQLNRTDQAGWTERLPDSRDARAQVVRLTEAGHQELVRARGQRAAVVVPTISTWPEDRRRRLAEAVELLEELLAEVSETGVPASEADPAQGSQSPR
ncbi:MarR family winged helix-turn-helix transcriptional regulator [Enemella dayhoffiae]|uniref:MarR family winged helix-turn-helix transcriptional regulator n=1 Tax=Enemella dayhoffiae TaxID=2016507 RepID=UPI0015960ACB|nr:MarR family winged helix-turn-helix transcriptional regulator [Enemella dayhoffiae]